MPASIPMEWQISWAKCLGTLCCHRMTAYALNWPQRDATKILFGVPDSDVPGAGPAGRDSGGSRARDRDADVRISVRPIAPRAPQRHSGPSKCVPVTQPPAADHDHWVAAAPCAAPSHSPWFTKPQFRPPARARAKQNQVQVSRQSPSRPGWPGRQFHGTVALSLAYTWFISVKSSLPRLAFISLSKVGRREVHLSLVYAKYAKFCIFCIF